MSVLNADTVSNHQSSASNSTQRLKNSVTGTVNHTCT